VINCCFILTACTDFQVKEKSETSIEVKVVEQKKQIAEAETEISPKVMFLLLTAELAGQRGQYGLALDGYLRAAAVTNDLEVVKRAASIAVFLQDEKRLAEAVDYWLVIDADDLEARQLKVVAAIQARKNTVAIEQINFILAKSPSDFDVRMQVVIKSLRKPEAVKVAYRVFRELSDLHPKNETFYFVMAYIDYRGKHFLNAQTNLTKALAIKTDWVKALLLQGQVYISQNKLALATESLQQAVAKKENLKISEQITQLLINQKRFKEALKVLRYLQESEPKNNAIKMQIVLVLLQLDKVDKDAELLLLELVNDPLYKNKSFYYLGRIAASQKQNQAAINWFNKVGVGKYQYEAKVRVVLLLMKAKDLTGALTKVREIKHDNRDKRSELALIESEILSREKEYQQAFDTLSGALLNDAENADILYARALMAEKVGNIKVLEEDLKYILEKRANDATALNALGYTLVDKTTRYQEAKLYIERALAIKPNEAVFIDSYGWLFFKMGNYETAKKHLEKAYSMEPQAEIAGHLVEVLMALNESEGAKKLLRDALGKNKDDQYLLILKKTIIK
jgi:tetratricopeptide (TPR) repeat protein